MVLFFAPSRKDPTWTIEKGQTRWDTKGYDETLKLLSYVTRKCPKIEPRIRYSVPHDECLTEKRRSDIAIDELVTGSFHISSLESLSQGIPTLAYLDQRSIYNLANLTLIQIGSCRRAHVQWFQKI